jgi:hypothetical protein
MGSALSIIGVVVAIDSIVVSCSTIEEAFDFADNY